MAACPSSRTMLSVTPQNCSGMAWRILQKAHGIDLASSIHGMCRKHGRHGPRHQTPQDMWLDLCLIHPGASMYWNRSGTSSIGLETGEFVLSVMFLWPFQGALSCWRVTANSDCSCSEKTCNDVWVSNSGQEAFPWIPGPKVCPAAHCILMKWSMLVVVSGSVGGFNVVADWSNHLVIWSITL